LGKPAFRHITASLRIKRIDQNYYYYYYYMIYIAPISRIESEALASPAPRFYTSVACIKFGFYNT